jgi:hypothetical protein
MVRELLRESLGAEEDEVLNPSISITFCPTEMIFCRIV